MEEQDIEARVLEAVEQTGEPYEVVRIDPAYAATTAFCAEYGYAPEQSGNCIIVASRTEPVQYAACLVRATHRLDVNRRVRRLLGVRRASFASADDTVRLTGMLPDGVTPFGLPAELPVYLDAGLLEMGTVIVGGGSRSLKLAVAPQTLLAVRGATVVDDLALQRS